MKHSVALLLFALAVCRTMPPPAPASKAFSPSFSSAQLSYVFKSALNFIDNPAKGTPDSAKAFLLGRGGLRNVPLSVELPDGSSIALIIRNDQILISGYSNAETQHWITISKERDGYHVRDAELAGGLGCGADFLVSPEGGHVLDQKALCIDTFQP